MLGKGLEESAVAREPKLGLSQRKELSNTQDFPETSVGKPEPTPRYAAGSLSTHHYSKADLGCACLPLKKNHTQLAKAAFFPNQL